MIVYNIERCVCVSEEGNLFCNACTVWSVTAILLYMYIYRRIYNSGAQHIFLWVCVINNGHMLKNGFFFKEKDSLFTLSENKGLNSYKCSVVIYKHDSGQCIVEILVFTDHIKVVSQTVMKKIYFCYFCGLTPRCIWTVTTSYSQLFTLVHNTQEQLTY